MNLKLLSTVNTLYALVIDQACLLTIQWIYLLPSRLYVHLVTTVIFFWSKRKKNTESSYFLKTPLNDYLDITMRILWLKGGYIK